MGKSPEFSSLPYPFPCCGPLAPLLLYILLSGLVAKSGVSSRTGVTVGIAPIPWIISRDIRRVFDLDIAPGLNCGPPRHGADSVRVAPFENQLSEKLQQCCNSQQTYRSSTSEASTRWPPRTWEWSLDSCPSPMSPPLWPPAPPL